MNAASKANGRFDASSAPPQDPDAVSLDAWRRHAHVYLVSQLGAHAPEQVGGEPYFDRSPLAGEGPLVVLPFRAGPGGTEAQDFFVVVGRTEPNYYPAWGLVAEEVAALHVGTRFMLSVGVRQANDRERSGYDPAADVRAIVDRVAPREPIEGLTVAAMFFAADERHAVCRCRVGGEEVYVMAADCPPGFYRQVRLPPHVVYRLHLGNVIRQEPAPADDADDS